jgi:hypothetical protein
MDDIAELMGAVTNCAVAGIQAGRDIGKAERDKLQSELDEALDAIRFLLEDVTRPGEKWQPGTSVYIAQQVLAKHPKRREREDARTEARILAVSEG